MVFRYEFNSDTVSVMLAISSAEELLPGSEWDRRNREAPAAAMEPLGVFLSAITVSM